MAYANQVCTSGWRAVVAEEFTFENIRRAVHGISRYVASQKTKSPKVIVGRDPRFLGETFCSMAAEILSSYQITPLVIADQHRLPQFRILSRKRKRTERSTLRLRIILRSTTGSNFQRPMGPRASGSDEIHRSGDCCTR